MTDSARSDSPASLLAVRNRQIAAVHQITQVLFAKLGLDERLRDVLAVSMRAVDATAGSIYLYREADDMLVFEYVVGPPDSSALVGTALPAHQGIAGHVFTTGETVMENQVQRDTRHRRDIGESVGFTTHSIVTVPLKTLEGAPVGVMQILNKKSGDFDRDDVEVLEIVAAIAATAIENSKLQREAQVAAVARAVGHLSHDIKNKVAPISMVAHMLRPDMEAMFEQLGALIERCSSEVRDRIESAVQVVRSEYQEHWDIVLDQVNAVQEHTKRISDVLKGITTRPQIELQDPIPLIEEQVRLLQPVARSRNLRLESHVEGEPVPVPLDKFFLSSAVYNLINNAIPETPEGGSIVIRTRFVADGEFPEGRCLAVEVTDTGSGMPPHVLDRILRGDATSTKVGGTGLGTKIVFNAAKAHGGVFLGSSEVGKGTTFV
ncbi:MAG: GAF domain-containing protein, partial [Chthonomonadales bacterium]|nr:GAF domain-containing protein [Chthonomonadales bacterium]